MPVSYSLQVELDIDKISAISLNVIFNSNLSSQMCCPILVSSIPMEVGTKFTIKEGGRIIGAGTLKNLN